MSQIVVLVAEDETDTIELLGLTLFHVVGVEAVLARDGVEVLEKVRELKPSLVLLDVRIGKLGGMAVARRLKADAATRHIPIIAIVGSEDARLDTAAAGFDDCLIKPLDVDYLAGKLRQYLPTSPN